MCLFTLAGFQAGVSFSISRGVVSQWHFARVSSLGGLLGHVSHLIVARLAPVVSNQVDCLAATPLKSGV